MADPRPIYFALGECDLCAMIDKRLWRMPGRESPMCAKCLQAHYGVTPEPRSAADVTEADTEYRRRRDDEPR